MKLKIKNFSGIKEEEIIFDGLTIVAGYNNTGKSTIGKIIATLFKSLNDLTEKREKERFFAIYRRLELSIDKFSELKSFRRIELRHIAEELNKLEKIDHNKVRAIFEKYTNNQELNYTTEDIDKIINIKKIPDNEVDLEILTNEFNEIFHDQINNIHNEEIAEINLIIKEKENILRFQNNKCIYYMSNTTIIHSSFYIDNPFYVDYMHEYGFSTEDLTAQLVEEKSNVIDSIMSTNKLKKVFEILNQVVPYQIVKENRDFYVKDKNNLLNVANLSTGIKSFFIIKRLIENGNLGEQDVLVLDEPEIHLHPEWQIIYAELIVILQKIFNLTIFITSHSPYFIESLDLFSRKHESTKITHFYLTKKDNKDNIIMEELENTENIFKLLADPFKKLEEIEYELNENDEK